MRSAQAIRLMVIDADRAFLGKLQRVLGGERPAMEIVAATSSHAEAVELAQEAKPDVILLAMGPGDTDHVGTIAKLCAASPAPILMLATVRDPIASARAVKAGARGVVLKDDAPEVMRKAVCKVHEGELWLDRLATARIVEELVAARARAMEAGSALDKLTARELEVVQALLEHQGGGSRDLAARLQVSEHTLRNHFTSIYRKLGVPNRVGLFAYASRHRFDVVG
jgi:two-component system nitrate/nitrite response regulator NarL